MINIVDNYKQYWSERMYNLIVILPLIAFNLM